MNAREVTESTIAKMLAKGDEIGLGEPVGVVVLYREEAFLKAVWTNDADRKQTATALITAATDEMSKA